MTKPTLNAIAPVITIVVAIVAVATATACATAPAGPPPFDPVGSYEYTAYLEGQPLPGTMTITEGEAGYEGTILSDAFPPIPVTSVVVEGQAVTIEAAGPGGLVVLTFTVTEGSIQGTWTMGEQGGDFTATKTG